MNLAHEVLLALAYVSQVLDPDSARARFIESLNEINDAYSFQYSEDLPHGVPEERVLPIATMHSSFGYAVTEACPGADQTECSVFRNAFRFLAVLLENRQQAQDLEATHESLQQELRREKSMVRTVLETMPVGVWVTDADGAILMGNAAAEEIWGGIRDLGLNRNDTYKGWRTDTGKSLAPDEWPISRVLATSGMVAAEEVHIESFDGLRKTILTGAAPVLDDEGRLTGVVGVHQDITERKRAEEALRQSEATMRYIIKHDPNAIAIYDRDLRYIAVSDRYVEDYGIDGESLVGKHHYEVFPEIPQRWRDVHQRVLAGAVEREEDDSFVRLDGSLTYNSWECRPWYEPSGSIGGIITYTEDTTERRVAQEALLASEEQLRQSQKMEAIGQLAGGIAHDFNNLLTAILGYSDMILSDEAAQCLPLRDDVEAIKSAAERAASLTKQILAFSRRQSLQPVVASLNDVVAGMDSLLRRTLGEHIDLVTVLHPKLGLNEVDPHQFEQVLMNLAVNARDAMPAGGKLTLETANAELSDEYCQTHSEVTPGPYVVLSISDTGVGMDKETKSHMFEPFFTTKAPGIGTGLGLATVYGIVRQSGGSISVSSELGEGTTFKIYLPRVSAPSSLIDQSPSPDAPPSRGQETIMVVEDEESLRRLVSRILGELGYTVVTAAQAAEALEILATTETSIDLLLTDIVLPGGIQGSELAMSLETSRPHLPVLLMSGYTRDAITHDGRLRDGVNYLEKPFTPQTLVEKVREVLDQVGEREPKE